MFAALSEKMTFATISILLHASDNLAKTQEARIFGIRLTQVLLKLLVIAPTPDCSPDSLGSVLAKGISSIVQIAMGVGISLSVLGIIVGGLMRATSFGNERRIAMSNTAITCSVVGIIIVLVGYSLGNAIPGWFLPGADTAHCQIQKQ